MHKTITTLFAFFIVVNGFAQPNEAYLKFGASLKELMSTAPASSRFISMKNSRKTVSVLIETQKTDDGYLLRKQGFALRTIIGTVATADIPLDKLTELARSPLIKRIELPLLLRKDDDTLMRRITTVQQVLDGLAPLDRAYRGESILVGVIDDGADISHPEFYDSSGNLRIKYLWNMDYNDGKRPEGFDYGSEWKAETMAAYSERFKQGQITAMQMQQLFGFASHGTSVTSLVAGNSGVAPKATIASVALTAFTDTLLYSDRVIDAIAYLTGIAKKESKKCVINISLGTAWGGPHDGKTLLEKAIDNFSNENPGVLICVSAGNNGNDYKHWGGFPIQKDSSYGFFRCAYKASIYFSIPKTYSKTLKVSIGESKLGNFSYPNLSRDSVFYQTAFFNIDSLIKSAGPAVCTSYLSNGRISSVLIFTASHYNEDYDELIITADERTSGTGGEIFDDHLYRFIWKGEGTVHGWYPFWNLHPISFGTNPLPDDSTFRITDNDFSTGIPSNAFTVISSGAYNIRTCYVNIQDKIVYQYEKCRTAYFTSHGPTLDGRIKPDVIAPGDNVLAARSRYDEFLGHDFIIDKSTIAFGGTSAASPITAGIAALAWEKYAEFSREAIIELIKSSANFDSFSLVWGNQPNNIAGWGKVDAFKTLTGESTDISALCAATDVCTTKRPPDTIPSPPPLPVNYFTIFPNPVQSTAIINYRSDRAIQYQFYDLHGRLIFSKKLPASNASTLFINMQFMAKGIYFVRVTGWEKPFTKKILYLGK